MHKPLKDHGFKVGDEVATGSYKYQAGDRQEVISQIRKIVKVSKAILTFEVGSLDLRSYRPLVLRLATDEDRQYIADRIGENKAARAASEARENKRHELRDLFTGRKPSVNSGNTEGTFDIEFHGLTIAEIETLAARLNNYNLTPPPNMHDTNICVCNECDSYRDICLVLSFIILAGIVTLSGRQEKQMINCTMENKP